MFLIAEGQLLLDTALRVAAAFGCGGLIGLERQWRSRSAGLRTQTLVSVGACLFVILSTLTPGDASPSRVAAQVVSGVGFLGAGVIIKDGASLRGINTAATLWASAAVGCLCGAGMYIPAIVGVVAILLANAFLRPIARKLERGVPANQAPDQPVDYEFTVVCRDPDEADVRALVVQRVLSADLHLHQVESEDIEGSNKVTVKARFTAQTRDDATFENAVSTLSLEPAVTSVRWTVLPHNEAEL